MLGPIRQNYVVLLIAMVMALTACNGAATPSTATQEPGASTPSVPESSDTAPVGETSFTVAVPSVGLSTLSLIAAVDQLRGDGYDIELVELGDAALITEGTARGDFAYSSGAATAVFLAVQQGAGIRLLADRVLNEWTIYARARIEGCDGLEAARYAVHSETDGGTLMAKAWVSQECPNVEPGYIIVAGSENRAAALIADQVDVTNLELADAVALDLQAPDEFDVLATLATDLPDLHTNTIQGNADFVAANPETTRALLRALLEQNRRINDEEGYLLELMNEHLDPPDADVAEAQAAEYVERGIFPQDGGLSRDAVQATLNFFEDTGTLEPGLTVDDVSDLSHLEAVVEELDG